MTDQHYKVRAQYTSENTEQGIALNIELPGVSKQDAKISSEGNKLSITAKRENRTPEDWTLINQANVAEEYELELELHKDFNLAEAKASFANGILKLEVAKHEAVLPKKIEILD